LGSPKTLFSSSAEQSLSEVAGGSVGNQKIEENEKAIAADEVVTAARRIDEEIASSSSRDEISRQIRKQSAIQVEIEKTLSLLDKSVKQIKQDLENSENQKEQYQQLLQEHNQILDESMKQIQTKITDLEKQIQRRRVY
jgi:DNA repair exonuclease SbcCD ATPase subunit